jgi:hypothetical protein
MVVTRFFHQSHPQVVAVAQSSALTLLAVVVAAAVAQALIYKLLGLPALQDKVTPAGTAMRMVVAALGMLAGVEVALVE